MKDFQTVLLEKEGNFSTIWLNRPEKRNALNEKMIDELTEAITNINLENQQRLIILRGKGKAFSSGADLDMMRDAKETAPGVKIGKINQLPRCLSVIYQSEIPVIGVAHGSVFGGANGILAACDIALAGANTVFAFSEVRLGLIPAAIAPYVMKRTGESKAREFMLTGKRFMAREAEMSGLINRSLPEDALEAHLDDLVQDILAGGPEAISICKSMISQIANVWDLNESLIETGKLILQVRGSEEAQRRMSSFLNKKQGNSAK
ncbi:MAG: enoyl-CoA hydratase/isomerase family protein [Cyclobacteriaceae bacterium]|nr:enoyl-CoA hydratase/isomerase family protein [Cyclobacteriaceae bacterium]